MAANPFRRPFFGTDLRRSAPIALALGIVLVLLSAAMLTSVKSVAGAQNPDALKPQGYVDDFANVLSASARAQITQLCTEVDQKAQAQIAVVTVRTLNGQSAFDYSLNLAMRWGVGPKQKDRGVLILVATEDHKYYTQVGYGLEGILPDGKVGGFGREAVPYFRQNNYDAGLLLMTKRVADVIAADRKIALSEEPAVAPPVNAPSEGSGSEAPATSTELIIVLILLFVIFRIIRAFAFAGSSGRYYRRRSGGWWIGPMLGGFGGGFGGGGWSGGGGGGGFGGFGGGSFGGGGAGGSW